MHKRCPDLKDTQERYVASISIELGKALHVSAAGRGSADQYKGLHLIAYFVSPGVCFFPDHGSSRMLHVALVGLQPVGWLVCRAVLLYSYSAAASYLLFESFVKVPVAAVAACGDPLIYIEETTTSFIVMTRAGAKQRKGSAKAR